MKKQTKEKSAAHFQLHLAMLDSLRNAPNGEWNSDILFIEVVKRAIDPRYVKTGDVANLTRSFAKAGYLQLINNKFHRSTRHGGNLVNCWKVLARNIPKTDDLQRGTF